MHMSFSNLKHIAADKVTVHHLASDDYVRQEAMFWLHNLRPDVQIYVEHSNEVWNPLFPQGRYATGKAYHLLVRVMRLDRPSLDVP